MRSMTSKVPDTNRAALFHSDFQYRGIDKLRQLVNMVKESKFFQTVRLLDKPSAILQIT